MDFIFTTLLLLLFFLAIAVYYKLNSSFQKLNSKMEFHNDENNQQYATIRNDLSKDFNLLIKRLQTDLAETKQGEVELKTDINALSVRIEDVKSVVSQLQDSILSKCDSITIDLKQVIAQLSKHIDTLDSQRKQYAEAEFKSIGDTLSTLVTTADVVKTTTGDCYSIDSNIKQSISQLSNHIDALDANRKNAFDVKSNSVSDSLKSLSMTVSSTEAVVKRYMDKITVFDQLIKQTTDLYQKIILLNQSINKQEEELRSSMNDHIHTQEKSLNGLVQKHVAIAQMTSELNQTSKDVYELLKLTLMTSIMEETRFLKDAKAKK